MILSNMIVGDMGILDGDVVRLMNGGASGGADHELYLAYVCDVRDAQTLDQEGIDVDSLTDIVFDTDNVSI